MLHPRSARATCVLPPPQVRVVSSVEAAISHINDHGSHHTDAIVTASAASAARFEANVDSAGVYVNASTRFADGNRYGFGAEVGVSTNRIHCRGPMGVEGLLIYKYVLRGDGHRACDYGPPPRAPFLHGPLALAPPALSDSRLASSGRLAGAWGRGLGSALRRLPPLRHALALCAAAVVGALLARRPALR